MANRALLHRSKLESFMQWMIEHEWVAMLTKGEYEAARLRKNNRWFILYDRDRGDHFTLRDIDQNIVRTFQKEAL